MVDVDPRLERIARRLTLAELSVGDDGDDADLLANRSSDRFVDTYSMAGLQRVLDEYGFTKALTERGLGDHRLVVTREDSFRHRLQLLLDDDGALGSADRVIMDLRLHLLDVKAGGTGSSVVVVDWLLMQNPRATFSTRKPRLPGQQHPGTGLGLLVHQVLVLLCRRIGRDGLVNVPERFHLAAMYRKLGYVGDAADDAVVAGVEAAAGSLPLPALAWAVERGCVSLDGHAYVYAPHELFCPVSKRLQRALSHPPAAPKRGFVVDVEALRASLLADPIDGLDASMLEG